MATTPKMQHPPHPRLKGAIDNLSDGPNKDLVIEKSLEINTLFNVFEYVGTGLPRDSLEDSFGTLFNKL